MTPDDARHLARGRLPRMIFDFIDGAAGDERLNTYNTARLRATRLMPRVLRNIGVRDLGADIFDTAFGLPFGIAPMGMCNLAYPQADAILAAQACERDIPLGVSTAASTALETLIEWSEGRAWFQLYAVEPREFVDELVERARVSGYRVLVLTVDVPILSTRSRDQRNGFTVPFAFGPRQLWDFATHPRWSLTSLLAGVPKPMNFATSSRGTRFVRGAGRGGGDWDFLRRLRDRWPGKLVVKGVLCPADAHTIRACGVDGLYVSNHGGRQLDAAPAAIDALAVIRQELGPGFPLIFDSGIRQGEDIVKALALGADFVMVGRPVMYGLGAGGAAGLDRVMDLLVHDLSTTLGLIGRTGIRDVSPEVLAAHHGLPDAIGE